MFRWLSSRVVRFDNSPSCKAFCLGILPYTDHQVLVDWYTEPMGLIRSIVRLGKKDSLRSSLVPLNLVEIGLSGKEQASLLRAQIHQVHRQLFDVSTSFLSLTLLQHWCFLVRKSQPDHQADPKVFRLLEHVSTFISIGPDKDKLAFANLYFEFWLLALNGDFPILRKRSDLEPLERGGFRVRSSEFVMVTNAMFSDADAVLLTNCFQQTIEEFLHNAIQYPGPDCLFEAAGLLWDTVVEKKKYTRTMLMDCFREKGIL